MENLKSSLVLKILAHILLPISILVVIGSIICISFVSEYPDIKGEKPYFETSSFSNNYINKIEVVFGNIERLNRSHLIAAAEETEEEPEITQEALATASTENEIIETETYKSSNMKYVVVDKRNNIYTNIEKTLETDSEEELVAAIMQEGKYWCYDGQNVNTNIEQLDYSKIAYQSFFEEMIQKGYKIYTSVDSNLPVEDIFWQTKSAYDVIRQGYQIAYFALPISVLVMIIAGLYLISSSGHRKNNEGITLNAFDKIPLEIAFLFICFAYGMEFSLAIATSENLASLEISFLIIAGALIYATTVLSVITITNRIKTKTFFKNSILCRIWKFLKSKTTKAAKGVFYNLSTTLQVAIVYGGFLAGSAIIVALAPGGGAFFILLLLGIWFWIFIKIVKKVNQLRDVKQAIYEMYIGKQDVRLKEDEYTGELKNVALYINDIAGGLSNAIEENMKNERLKTELITNVSHDLKTPLTSIINYVDLLKQEEIDNNKAKEYIDVLDRKSQRLKKLTEDLVEASKASSGAVKFNIEKLNVKELLKQVTGEFEDRFHQKKLEVYLGIPNEECTINADSRYLYRVIENLYSNIAKYALTGSRVYIDVVTSQLEVVISIKNISQQKLNISTEELMQRFVRGDSSRNTEGSGLGLSIARSLTELQEGKFDIYLDGDLFKVILKFKKA